MLCFCTTQSQNWGKEAYWKLPSLFACGNFSICLVLLIQYWFVVLCRGGFFTLKHEVSDISPLVHQLHSYQDPVTIEILTTEVGNHLLYGIKYVFKCMCFFLVVVLTV